MIKRRDLLFASAAMLIVPRLAQAQKKIPIIGVLGNASVRPSPFLTGVTTALRDRGFVVGRDFAIDDRTTLEGYSGYDESIAALIQANVDVILTNGATASVAAAKATKRIPIVMIVGIDPVAAGIVGSLSRPGGNVTGVYTLAATLNAKRVELLKELRPTLSSFGLLLAPNVGNVAYRRDCEAAASALGLRLHVSEARSADEIESAIEGLVKQGVEALFISPATMLAAQNKRVIDAVANSRLPAVYSTESYADAGGLMVYAPSVVKNRVRAAGYVERILKGARPGDLPVDQSSDVDLLVNLRTAKALGIKVPQSIIVRADRVIE